MGNCTVSGGIFTGGYSQVDGIDQILPVDIYVPGCPPRPEALIRGIMELQRRIQREESLVRGVRLQLSIPPGSKAVHPWGAPEQVLRHLYQRFYAESDA
jgi:NADH:ubiquinone oxidoreductase subunit B-like Fe-S oxidoreductase